MAWGVKLTLTNDSECTQYYRVEYKKDFETQYQVVSPNPVSSPVIIEGLDACTTYNFRVTRRCCNGQDSSIALANQVTGGDCEPI